MAAGGLPGPLPVLRPQSPPLLRSARPLLRYTRRKAPSIAASSPGGEVRKEDVVVVGAGIAGLATAVSLSRLGVRSLVLEQGDSLRTGGTSLTLFKNGWRALDAIGVGDELRPQFLEIQGLALRSDEGRLLRSFLFKDVDASQEVRAVERRVLLETLASQLPNDTICFSSRLKAISRGRTNQTLLELEDGTQLLAKIVIGCDGVHSPVAKWMGFSNPNYVGHCAFRGLGLYPEGQPFEPEVNYLYGRGLRAGYVPVSSTKVYWFICFNSPSPGPRTDNPSALKKEAQELVEKWPSELVNIINRTPENSIIRTPLVDRWLWPLVTPRASDGGVVVVGDAWHPMTPNLGQGACCALEDSVILARKLASAFTNGLGHVDEVLNDYSRERWGRVFPLTIRANLVGSLLQWDNPAVCAVRDNIVIPKLVQLGPLLEHTQFDSEFLRPFSAARALFDVNTRGK
uniref:3-hydroxybenzoate 6-hydroxylase 1 n=1 Tax=Anthurium amnicola TaxID=1678845 RepID=A0A1D1YA14_9ARAE